jgi:hypothetical protein
MYLLKTEICGAPPGSWPMGYAIQIQLLSAKGEKQRTLDDASF